MKNPAYYDLCFYLQENGLGTLGSDLFGGEWGVTYNNTEQNDIDRQVLVLGGVATPSDLKDLYENVSIQILVRGAKNEPDYQVGQRAYTISKFLLSQPESICMNGVGYKGFEEGTPVAPLGKDENERFVYSMNFTTYRNA